MDFEKVIEILREEQKSAYEYAKSCEYNSVQEYWFGQSNGFTKAINVILEEAENDLIK